MIAAMKKPESQFALQGIHLLDDGRRGKEKFVCSFAEAPLLRHTDQRGKLLVQNHVRHLFVITFSNHMLTFFFFPVKDFFATI